VDVVHRRQEEHHEHREHDDRDGHHDEGELPAQGVPEGGPEGKAEDERGGRARARDGDGAPELRLRH
jgi:hypothetical protein